MRRNVQVFLGCSLFGGILGWLASAMATTYVEEYVVDLAIPLSPDLFQLAVHRKPPGSTAPTPVSTILLIKGATSTTNRTGMELGAGATVSLIDSDFAAAVEDIGVGDIISYVSEPISSTRPPPRAKILGFNFPMSPP